MKKVIIMLMMLAISLFWVISKADAEEKRLRKELALLGDNSLQVKQSDTLDFPKSLITIEEGAFEGTGIKRVNIPDTVISIGNNSFANNAELLFVFLPDSIKNIEGNPFTGSNNVELHGFANSFSQRWATRGKMRFFLEISLSASKEAKVFVALSPLSGSLLTNMNCSCSECIIPIAKENDVGRPEGDLKADANDGVAALYIQSRYFP